MPAQEEDMSPSHVALIGVCEHCGESVHFMVTAQELQILLKAFKLPIKTAQKYVELRLAKVKG